MKKIKRKQKKQLALLAIVMLVAALAAIILLTPGFDIKEIKVYGNSVLSEETIVRSSGLVKGVNTFGVSLGEAEENIMSMGYIESVKIKRSLPSAIEITVVEEVGVAYIKAESGYVIISADGRCIDITDGITKQEEENGKNTASAPELPLIKGMKNLKYKVGGALKADDEEQLNALVACLYEFSKHGYVFDMTQIDMTDINDIKFYYKGNDLCVTVGRPEKLGYKMECFGPILAELDKELVGYIDLQRLTYRKENPPKPKNEEKMQEEE